MRMAQIRDTRPSLPAALLLGVSALLGGCPEQDPGPDPDAACTSTRDLFERDVWGAFMGQACLQCHSPDGVAVTEHKARFVLQPTTYPGFLDANLEATREMVRLKYDDRPMLVVKPVGTVPHGGGAIIQADSKEYAALQELVKRIEASTESTSCPDNPPGMPEGLVLLPPAQAFRKATLDLAGRLPTTAETQSLEAGGEAALKTAVDAVLREPAFLDRLGELWNDVLLTDKYAWKWNNNPIAIDLMNRTDYPGAAAVDAEWDADRWASLTPEERVRQNDAIGREPIRLIQYVVKNDRPFSEILTANYTPGDRFAARVYGIEGGPTGDDVAELQVKLPNGENLPHAGLLSMPAFLNRFQTTPTNRSRARARYVLKTFLATDILKIAERPVDVTAAVGVDNPTRNYASCTVCHNTLDPIAGAFRAYDEQDYERWAPGRNWHDDMLPPGFGDALVPGNDYDRSLPWLAAQVAADPRFDLAVVEQMVRAFIGKEPLPYPPTSDPEFTKKRAAWASQQEWLRGLVQGFRDSNRNLRTLVRDIVTSAPYRAIGAPENADEITYGWLGTDRLLTPEQLDRRIAATTGYPWRRFQNWTQPPQTWLSDEGLALLYGGIDSTDVTERVRSPNGAMANLAARMTHEVACLMVPNEFAKPQEERTFFREVKLEEIPEVVGHEVPGSIASIKKAYVALHERLLGEKLDVASPEVERAYQLFVQTWREGNENGANARWLDWPCSVNVTTGENLPEPIRRDANYAVRAWTAVVSYILSDWRFLHE